MHIKQKKTFTLIEMLIVIVIIGILAAALIPRLQSVQTRARNTQRRVAIRQISDGVRIYNLNNSAYPNSLTFLITGNIVSNLPLDPQVPNNDPCNQVTHGWVNTGSTTGFYGVNASQNYGWLYTMTNIAVNGSKFAAIGARMEKDGGQNSYPIYFSDSYSGLQILCVQPEIPSLNGYGSWATDGWMGLGLSIKTAYNSMSMSSGSGWYLELIEN